jgi:DNA polymerase III subunit epsilon
MLQLKKPLAVIDIEATGSNPSIDRIVEIAIIKIMPDGNRTIKRKLLNPQLPIPQNIVDIHGISNEMVKDAPVFKQAAQEIKQFMDGCDISCYNAYRLDLPILIEEFIRADVEFDMKNRKVVDVQKIYHQMEQRTLSAAYKFYCGKSLEGAHGAEIDAAATAEILNAQLERYPQLGNTLDTVLKAIGDEQIIDYARRFTYNDKGQEIFNFGKHKGRTIADVLKAEPQYYDWMMKGEFPMNTKQKLTEIYTKNMLKKS